MTNTEVVAFKIQAEINRLLGHIPAIEQVDFVKCAGLDNFWMVYCYFRDGDELDPFGLENPPPFNRRDVEHALIRGSHETAEPAH